MGYYYGMVSYIVYAQFLYYLAITEWLIIATALAAVLIYLVGLFIAIARSVNWSITKRNHSWWLD